MKKKLIRTGVFETNSSSSHSVSIADETKEFVLDTLYPDQNGVITLNGGEYGWEWFKHNDAETKANYAAQSLGMHSILVDIIKEQTGANDVIISTEYGYIDHQSYGIIPTNKEELRNFIFNKNSWLFGGDDNSTPDPTFYHVPEYRGGRIINTEYKYELTVEGYDQSTKFIEYPDEDGISNGLVALLSDVLLTDSGYFDTDNSIYAKISRNRDNYFEFSTWKGGSIDFENGICFFVKDAYYDAKCKYELTPESKTDDWSEVGYKKVRDIEEKLYNQKNTPYKKAVKFFIKEIGKK